MFSNVLTGAHLKKCNIHSTFSSACNAHISPQVSIKAPPNSTVFKSGFETSHSWNFSALLAYVFSNFNRDEVYSFSVGGVAECSRSITCIFNRAQECAHLCDASQCAFVCACGIWLIVNQRKQYYIKEYREAVKLNHAKCFVSEKSEISVAFYKCTLA